jgi:hypothetical protein
MLYWTILLNEFSDNLQALDKLAGTILPGKLQIALEDRTQKILSDDEIMEEWQISPHAGNGLK